MWGPKGPSRGSALIRLERDQVKRWFGIFQPKTEPGPGAAREVPDDQLVAVWRGHLTGLQKFQGGGDNPLIFGQECVELIYYHEGLDAVGHRALPLDLPEGLLDGLSHAAQGLCRGLGLVPTLLEGVALDQAELDSELLAEGFECKSYQDHFNPHGATTD